MFPPGMFPPGMFPPGMFPPGMMPPPPGMFPQGMFPHGMMQPPPGMFPPGMLSAGAAAAGSAVGGATSATSATTESGRARDDDDDDGDERNAKRARVEKDLEPADEWEARIPSVQLRVMVPNDSSKPQWKLNGQALELNFNSDTTVALIKAQISSLLGDLPPNKQKLSNDKHGILKDDYSLAKYNFAAEETISLVLKSRGGKK